jgi:hypothetical protein
VARLEVIPHVRGPEALVARALAHASRRQIAQRHAPPGVPPASGLGLHTEPTSAPAPEPRRRIGSITLRTWPPRTNVRTCACRAPGLGGRMRVAELSTLARPVDRAR